METATSATLVWIVLLPLIGSVVLAVGRNSLGRSAIGWLGSLLVGASFVVTLAAMSQLSANPAARLVQHLFDWAGPASFSLAFGLAADQLALWWLLIVTGVGFLIHFYSITYMRDEESYGRFFAEMNYFIAAMSLLVLADNFVGLLIGWANVGFASFLLIGFWNRKPEALAAARKAFLINVAGELGMIVALALMFQQFGAFDYDTVFGGAAQASPGVVTAICMLLLVGVVSKSAQFPLQTWLPDAMQGPTPVSALIHAATMVTAGVYLVIRAFPLFEASPVALDVVAVIGVISALFGAVVATRQFDIKRVLAYSTMSQLGFMMIAAGVGAYTAAAFHFFTHAFFKALLFLGAGMVSHHLGGEQDIRKMGGLGKQMPLVYWTFLAGVLAIAGAPGFAGFFSKDEILGALLAEGRTGLWVAALVAAGLTAYYMARLFVLVFAGAPAARAQEAEGQAHTAHGGNGTMSLPVALLGVLSVVSGLIAVPGWSSVPQDYLVPVFEAYNVHPAHGAGWGWPVAVVLLVALVGFVVAVRMFGPAGSGRKRALASTGRRLRGPVASAFYVDDVYMAGVGAVGRWAKSASLRVHSGYLRRYALTLFAGCAAFLFYFLLL